MALPSQVPGPHQLLSAHGCTCTSTGTCMHSRRAGQRCSRHAYIIINVSPFNPHQLRRRLLHAPCCCKKLKLNYAGWHSSNVGRAGLTQLECSHLHSMQKQTRASTGTSCSPFCRRHAFHEQVLLHEDPRPWQTATYATSCRKKCGTL